MKRLWFGFAAVMILSFLVLGWIGTRIYQEMPPIPGKFVTSEGVVLIDNGEIGAGQNVWQSLGGMQVGSIWGHGSYVAPDWTADWLHREATFILNKWAMAEFGTEYDAASTEQQSQLSGRLSELAGGIIGTCHHLYFSGTPTVALAWGSVFSALEVVPLTLIGFDAVEDLRRSRSSPWVQRYK